MQIVGMDFARLGLPINNHAINDNNDDSDFWKMTFKREPVLYLAILQALLTLMISFGLHLSSEQVGSIIAVSAAILGFITRTQVSPNYYVEERRKSLIENITSEKKKE